MIMTELRKFFAGALTEGTICLFGDARDLRRFGGRCTTPKA